MNRKAFSVFEQGTWDIRATRLCLAFETKTFHFGRNIVSKFGLAEKSWIEKFSLGVTKQLAQPILPIKAELAMLIGR